MVQRVHRLAKNKEAIQDECGKHAADIGHHDGRAVWHPSIQEDARADIDRGGYTTNHHETQKLLAIP